MDQTIADKKNAEFYRLIPVPFDFCDALLAYLECDDPAEADAFKKYTLPDEVLNTLHEEKRDSIERHTDNLNIPTVDGNISTLLHHLNEEGFVHPQTISAVFPANFNTDT